MTSAAPALWKAWRARRDAAAFESLVRDEVPYALDLARRMGARAADAEDAVQEALLQLAREQSDDPVDVGLRAWICRRVVLRTKMQARASSRRRRHEGALRPRPAATPAPLEIQDEVQVALRHLGEAERRAVVLRYLHDLDYRELAYVFGVSENACRLRVHKALKRLRALLGARAPALIAAVGLPVASVDAATFAAVAVEKSGAALGAGLAAKAAAAKTVATKAVAATVLAGAVTTAVVLWPNDPTLPPAPPPVVVAEQPPEPAPVAPAPKPELKPAPQPPAPAPVREAEVLRLLRGHLDGRLDAGGRLADGRRMAAVVEAPAGEAWRVAARGDVTEFDPREVPDSVGTVAFGPGVFRLTGPFRPKAAFAVTGAGTDATVLRAAPGRALVRPPDSMPGLVLRDFTWEGDDFLDVTGDLAALVERVRVRGWTATAGHGAAIGVRGRAWLALRACEFVGGYRRPAGGHALNVRGGALALLEGCRFVDLGDAVRGVGERTNPRSRVRLDGSTLENTRPFAAPTRFPVVNDDGAFRVVPRCTLRELKAVLDGFRPRQGERVTGMQLLTWPGLATPYFVIHLRDAGQARRVALVQGGREVEDPGLVLPRLPGRDRDSGATRSLRDVLRAAWSRLDPDEAACGIVEWALNGEDGLIPTVCLQDRFEGGVLHIVAASGEIQR